MTTRIFRKCGVAEEERKREDGAIAMLLLINFYLSEIDFMDFGFL
jgi:hypothetical protein